MEQSKNTTFNLNIRRPQVLLIGNGLCYANGIPWEELIQKVARDNVDIEKYRKKDAKGFHVPNTVLTLATSETEDKVRHEKYKDVFKDTKYDMDENMEKLMVLPFDAVLSTNYTYELEAVFNRKYPNLSAETKRKKYALRKDDVKREKYLLHTYNLMAEGKPEIWHIHGELRCPSSIVLSHDEYARLVRKIIEFNSKRGGSYEKDRKKLEIKSWIDYFLMGDVYVLGLSYDYSDFDLWWLLGRRLREHSGCGKFIFYEPIKKEEYYKQLALRDAGVDVRNCSVTIKESTKGKDYARFYKRAITDIQNQLLR